MMIEPDDYPPLVTLMGKLAPRIIRAEQRKLFLQTRRDANQIADLENKLDRERDELEALRTDYEHLVQENKDLHHRVDMLESAEATLKRDLGAAQHRIDDQRRLLDDRRDRIAAAVKALTHD